MWLGLRAEDVVAVVLGVVDEGAGRLVDPVVGDDPVPRGACAGGQRGVPRRRLGVRVRVVRGRVVRPVVQEETEAPLDEAIAEAGHRVAAQLVDRDLKDEVDRTVVLKRRRRDREQNEGRQHESYSTRSRVEGWKSSSIASSRLASPCSCEYWNSASSAFLFGATP